MRLKTMGWIVAILLAGAGAVAAETTKVVMLGDSLTAGYGLRTEDGLVPQMGRWLQAEGVADVALVNAGVSGDTTAAGLARLDWSLDAETDALVVILGGNDILRGIDPAVTRANLEAILQGAAARDLPVLLVGLYASQNYGTAYKAAFERIHPELAEAYGALYEPNFFQGLSDGSNDPSAYLKYMQRDGIHPSAEGVARIVERIGPKFIELIEAAR